MHPALKRKLIYINFLFRRLGAFVIFSAIVFIVLIGVLKIASLSKKTGITPKIAIQLLFSTNLSLKSNNRKTNILLLGMAGGNHAGGDLADSIIITTIDQAKNKVFVLSVPRDIWVPSMKDKVNTAYHYGLERSGNDGGFVLAKAAAEEVLGLPIHYIWIIDFKGFRRIIDVVGGVDIEVAKSFIDKEFPVNGMENDDCNGDRGYTCRYETVQFEKGLQHMDGERALKYARSRHAQGDQGSDISRGKRQQQVLSALYKKLFTWEFLLNFKKVTEFISSVNQTAETDMSIAEILFAGRFFIKTRNSGIESISLPVEDLKEGESGILTNPPLWLYSNRWVLIPQNEDYEMLHEYIMCRLEQNDSCE